MLSIKKNTISENKHSNILTLILTLFSIISIRTFLDNFAYPNTDNTFFPTERFVHFYLYFFSVFLSLSLLLYFLTKKSFSSVFNFLLKPFSLILLIPLIDLTLSGKATDALKYVPVSTNELFAVFLKLIDPLSGQGITIGQHIIFFFMMLFMAFFVFKNSDSLLKVFLLPFFSYVIIFAYAIIPSIIVMLSFDGSIQGIGTVDAYNKLLQQSWLSNTTTGVELLNKVFIQLNSMHEIFMSRFFWLMATLQIIIILLLANKTKLNLLKKFLDSKKILLLVIVALSGTVINQELFGNISLHNPINYTTLSVFIAVIALCFWKNMLMINAKVFDENFSKKEITAINIVSSLLIIFGALTLNRTVVILFIVIQSGYYLYTTHLSRDWEIPIIKPLIFGVISILISMSGFFLASPDQRIFAFPIKAITTIGLFVTIISIIIQASHRKKRIS
ncbi:MAG: hypothetical protein ACD_8C00118G0005 [uncultured bacterium]|nr:MAG: hypothetical protein ACD_8C00118G0005 [uncultured bacterium]